jgi:hypothetical protein
MLAAISSQPKRSAKFCGSTPVSLFSDFTFVPPTARTKATSVFTGSIGMGKGNGKTQ